MTERQKQVLDLYNKGYKVWQIAWKLGVDKSTASRTLKRALNIKCPFSSKCENCPLPDCAIKDEYAQYVNNRNYNPKRGRLSHDDAGRNYP